MHLFERYANKHGHYPSFERELAGSRIQVLLAPGYIRLRRKSAEIYIPRRELIPLLRWLVPLVRDNPAPSFDPELATDEYLEQEFEIRRELRRQKKEAHRQQVRERAALRKRTRVRRAARRRRPPAEED